ncbi:MAG: HAD family hydrolase [Chloroflexi bacterium]|nr:HAD family hydrolase [Chloroflexota bacterium]
MVAIVLSFDIDGTLELGDPPGGVTIEMVRRAHELGFIVGSCSDRPLSSQRGIWGKIEITPAFILAKHQLGRVRASVEADSYYHMGDRDTDFQIAQEHDFGFWWTHEAIEEPWLLMNPGAKTS